MDLDKLTDIHKRLDALRNAPATILSTSVGFSDITPRAYFKKLKELTDLVSSPAVQEALAAAAKSEQDDKTDLSHDPRRSVQKRRRPPSAAGSPQPYVGLDRPTRSPFPPESDGLRPLRADELAEYIREFNRTHSSKLHIWTRIRNPRTDDQGKGPPQLGNPVNLRFTIQNVLVCYMTMGHSSNDPTLVAECITAFGPREKKSPYSQSDFLVYQSLSQHLASLLQAHPRASFQNLVNLLQAYEGLFIQQCGSCGRVLSESHEPPVMRTWDGGWQRLHVECDRV
ncbi:hypothetical protein C8F01DRAFT_1104095 [Mycena amicta]|nr:hypothetical protein C8F01DRAFT_1104095 [Mycena amicta]